MSQIQFTRYVTVRVSGFTNKETSPEEVIQECEYSFMSFLTGTAIDQTEIIDIEEKR